MVCGLQVGKPCTVTSNVAATASRCSVLNVETPQYCCKAEDKASMLITRQMPPVHEHNALTSCTILYRHRRCSCASASTSRPCTSSGCDAIKISKQEQDTPPAKPRGWEDRLARGIGCSFRHARTSLQLHPLRQSPLENGNRASCAESCITFVVYMMKDSIDVLT